MAQKRRGLHDRRPDDVADGRVGLRRQPRGQRLVQEAGRHPRQPGRSDPKTGDLVQVRRSGRRSTTRGAAAAAAGAGRGATPPRGNGSSRPIASSSRQSMELSAQQTSVVRPDRRLRRRVGRRGLRLLELLRRPTCRRTSTLRQTQLDALSADITKGVATARRLPEFQAQVDRSRSTAREPEGRAAGAEGRRRHPAPPAGPGDAVEPDASALHAAAAEAAAALRELPYKLHGRGLVPQPRRCSSIASASSRGSSTSATSRSRRSTQPEPNATIVADLTATTFVLQEAAPARGGRGAPPAR